MYVLVATNIGSDPTVGAITLEAVLPTGLTYANVGAGGIDNDPESPTPTCSEPEPQVVTCTTPGPLHPGRWLGAKIMVDVADTAAGTLSLPVSVEGGGAVAASDTLETEISPDPFPFDFLFFDAPLTDEDGAATTQAASHPYQLTVDLGFPVEKVGTTLIATEHPKQVRVDLPRGLIANPEATPVRCTEAQLIAGECPPESQIGLITVNTLLVSPQPVTSPLYNMVPPYGVPAELGVNALGIGLIVHMMGGVKSDGDYGLFATTDDILARSLNPLFSATAQLWGDPSSDAHNQAREADVEPQDTAFLTLPSECSGAPAPYEGHASSWQNPGVFKHAAYASADLAGAAAPVDGCNQLAFEPSFEAKATTNLVDSPSGLSFKLHQPQDFDLEGLSTAALKDATVTLPAGMVANPSQANGLAACSPAEIGLTSAIGASPVRFDKDPIGCPDAAKLGKVQVSTPLLADPMPGPDGLGAVYLAEPFQNPFGSLLAIYIAIDDPATGTVAKLAGRVIPDPNTGQLTTVFEENPQLPLEDIELELFEGDRAPLRTPPTCGAAHATAASFVPWSAPEAPSASPTDAFALSASPAGACPTTPQAAPHSPAFEAGTLNPQAAAHSPFVFDLRRGDGSQEVTGLEALLAPGLTAKLAGVPNCPEAAIAAARGREAPNLGALEQASPSCPAASQLGTVTVAAGAGPSPFHTQGRVYLAGPYEGAPLSVVIITPAVAGPFDLGAVVVRVALYLNPLTAQVRAVSDPLPRILEGIPLDLRSATLSMDRPDFTLNPTNCDEMSIGATATSVFGQVAALASRFQVGGCRALPFKPRLKLRLLGGTKRGAHPRFRAILRPRGGDANIASATISLPRSQFVDQAHIRTVCTRVQFAADACPQGSIYGKVKATTPLLDEPLQGPVYLRSSDNELPDAVAVLKGPPSRPIEVEGVARIDSVRGRGVRINIDTVPDAPITEVVVNMQGGRKGLLINSRNLCARTYRASVQMDGQNGKTHDFKPALRNDCKKKKRQGRGKHARRGQARN